MKRSIVMGAVVVVGLLACDDEMAELGGEALRDAGEVLADAGAMLSDAGGDAASAQEDGGSKGLPAVETVELQCDKVYRRVRTTSNDPASPYRGIAGTYTYEEHYAVLVLDDTAPVIGADAIRCGRQRIGTMADPDELKCTGGTLSYVTETCEGKSYAGMPSCEFVGEIGVTDTEIRVPCGSRTLTVCAEGATACSRVDTGELFDRVRLTIRRQ